MIEEGMQNDGSSLNKGLQHEADPINETKFMLAMKESIENGEIRKAYDRALEVGMKGRGLLKAADFQLGNELEVIFTGTPLDEILKEFNVKFDPDPQGKNLGSALCQLRKRVVFGDSPRSMDGDTFNQIRQLIFEHEKKLFTQLQQLPVWNKYESRRHPEDQDLLNQEQVNRLIQLNGDMAEGGTKRKFYMQLVGNLDENGLLEQEGLLIKALRLKLTTHLQAVTDPQNEAYKSNINQQKLEFINKEIAHHKEVARVNLSVCNGEPMSVVLTLIHDWEKRFLNPDDSLLSLVAEHEALTLLSIPVVAGEIIDASGDEQFKACRSELILLWELLSYAHGENEFITNKSTLDPIVAVDSEDDLEKVITEIKATRAEKGEDSVEFREKIKELLLIRRSLGGVYHEGGRSPRMEMVQKGVENSEQVRRWLETASAGDQLTGNTFTSLEKYNLECFNFWEYYDVYGYYDQWIMGSFVGNQEGEVIEKYSLGDHPQIVALRERVAMIYLVLGQAITPHDGRGQLGINFMNLEELIGSTDGIFGLLDADLIKLANQLAICYEQGVSCVGEEYKDFSNANYIRTRNEFATQVSEVSDARIKISINEQYQRLKRQQFTVMFAQLLKRAQEIELPPPIHETDRISGDELPDQEKKHQENQNRLRKLIDKIVDERLRPGNILRRQN